MKILYFFIFLLFLFLVYSLQSIDVIIPEIYLVRENDTATLYDNFKYCVKSTVSSESNSMGKMLNYRHVVCSKFVDNYTNLREGHIYIYRKNDTFNVVHRLVKDCSKGCYGYIFMGDVNYYADKVVNRSQIVKEVVRIDYK